MTRKLSAKAPGRSLPVQMRQALLLGLAFNLYRLRHRPAPVGCKQSRYDSELLSHEQVDVKALLNLQGVVRTSHSVINGRSHQNLDGFAAAGEWEALLYATLSMREGKGNEA